MAEYLALDGSIHDDMGGEALANPQWPVGCLLLTTEQAAALRSPSLSQVWANYQTSARLALTSTDTTIARILEAISLGLTTVTTPDVVTFMQYRKDLRAILTQVQPRIIPTTLPIKPPYPMNT